jgi:hypothetical protein
MVCPNRLFALDSLTPTELRRYSGLSAAVQDVLNALGATPMQAEYPVGVWAEMRVEQTRGQKKFNYRFDFILNPVERLTPQEFCQEWGVSSTSASRTFALLPSQFHGYVPVRVPGWPIIVEVMTASTSGSDQGKGTGIKPAFNNAWDAAMNGSPLLSLAPGPNARQVWGRMVSQLIAKSEAAEQWGGRTVWLLQDLLLAHLMETTHISQSYPAAAAPRPLPLKGANIVSYKFGGPASPGAVRDIVLDRYISEDIPTMFNERNESTLHGILHAPFVPDASVLGLKLLQAEKPTPSLKLIILP